MADNETTKMNLQNDITIVNDKGVQRFKRGMQIEVPKAQADDIARIDYEAQSRRSKIMEQHIYDAPLGHNPQV